jgi:hypothetical protein
LRSTETGSGPIPVEVPLAFSHLSARLHASAQLAGTLEIEVCLAFGAPAAEDAMSSVRLSLAAVLAFGIVLGACALPGVPSSGPSTPEDGGDPIPETGIALPPAWTDTPSPTTAPPTLTPTPTPPFGLAWATPVPSDTDFDGWVRLESRRASLWLPPGFEAADLGEFGDLMALMAYAMTETMGEMASAFASPVPGRPTPTLVSLEELQQTFLFDFVLAGSEADEAALFLVGEPPKQDAELGTAIQGTLDGFQGEHTVESQHAIANRPYPAARLVVSSTDAESGRSGKHLIYVFVLEDRAWSLNYAAPAERFEELLPLFEKSAASFALAD